MWKFSRACGANTQDRNTIIYLLEAVYSHTGIHLHSHTATGGKNPGYIDCWMQSILEQAPDGCGTPMSNSAPCEERWEICIIYSKAADMYFFRAA